MEETTLEKIATEVEQFKTYKVYLKQPMLVHGIARKNIVQEFSCRFFLSNPDRKLCYKPLGRKRSGYYLYFEHNIEKIVEFTQEEKKFNVLDNAKTLLKKLHPNVWHDLREELQNAVDKNDASLLEYKYMIQGKVKYRNIAADIKKHEYNKTYAKYILEAIEKVFNDTSDDKTGVIYRWSHSTTRHTGRDLSLSIERNEKDGLLRAWFSSEYMGCGNGDYYLLINPTTAIFCETD